ncbi:hypothetical protein ACFLZ8_00345 [Planctomycetota bacterium]
MNIKFQKSGFSLTEVLLALGTLTVGLTLISGTFLAGIYLSTVSTERTIAAIVADEAFAKIQLYGIDLLDPNIAADTQISVESFNTIPDQQYAYPSTKINSDKQYYWSALCRPVTTETTGQLVQVTVFVARKVGNATYPPASDRPVPVEVGVSFVSGSGQENKLKINSQDEQSYINDGCKIVDNLTGRIYRVLERSADTPDTITLDRTWQDDSVDSVWVVPPPIGGGKKPDITVFQKIIRFE